MGKIIADWQCRAGRSALNWKAQDLAEASGLSRRTVEDFERGKAIKEASIERIVKALEAAGVRFTDEGCVCLGGGKPSTGEASGGTISPHELNASNDE